MLGKITESTCPICAARVSAALSWHPSEHKDAAHEAHVYVEVYPAPGQPEAQPPTHAAEQPETHVVPNGCHHYKITPTSNGASVTISFSEKPRE